MKEIRLNGAKMLDKTITHAYLKRKLTLPEYYGNNLDALWDCLSTDFSPKKIIIYKPAAMIKNLGPYGATLLKIFREAAEKNKCIQLDVEDD